MSQNPIDISKIKLETPKPAWGSDLANIILELEKLRVRVLHGSTPNHIFFEIKNIFQFLESLGSARIEGNNTTISELVEKVIDNVDPKTDESLAEILNINKAIDFINSIVKNDTHINKSFITELHKIVVTDLQREGAKVIGNYREVPVSISNSNIKPPEFLQVEEYMDNLFTFINQVEDTENHLLRIAIAHHYFTVVHPFDNGNGRVVRLLTFAMLIKYGFNIKNGNIINPTAIFCNDRNKYYEMLTKADNGHIEEWCMFVLIGLKEEINKIDKISQYEYMNKMFKSVLSHSLEKKYIDKQIYEVLILIINNKNMSITAGDLSSLQYMDTSLKRSRLIKKLKDLKMIKSVDGDKSRAYTISFIHSILLRSLTYMLTLEGFIPQSLNNK